LQAEKKRRELAYSLSGSNSAPQGLLPFVKKLLLMRKIKEEGAVDGKRVRNDEAQRGSDTRNATGKR